MPFTNMLSLLMPLTCLWSFCIFWWFAADHALMGEVKVATTVTSWWVNAMLKQLWRLVPWRRVRRLLFYVAILISWVLCVLLMWIINPFFNCGVTLWLFLVAWLGITFGGLTQALFLTFLMCMYTTQSAAMRFGHKKTGKPPRLKTGRPVRGWWTPYIFAYGRLTNLIKMSEDIWIGLKGSFGQKSSVEKKSRKNKYEWHYRLNIIG
eukprot:14916758-Ditylum_brightwellii.AAC.2